MRRSIVRPPAQNAKGVSRSITMLSSLPVKGDVFPPGLDDGADDIEGW
jgi:hypothetical protein